MILTTLPDSRNLQLTPVTNMHRAEKMRVVRNSVRKYMTHNTDPIDYRQQFLWYQDTYRPAHERGEMDAFLATIGRTAVGYGIIQTIDQKKWVTGAIMAGARGHGYGKDLFVQLTDRVHENEAEAWLDVREDNTRAVELYEKIGYLAVEHVNGLIIMKHEVQTC